MNDEWDDQPPYRTPAHLSDEQRRRAARQGLAEARAILAGARRTEPVAQTLEAPRDNADESR